VFSSWEEVFQFLKSKEHPLSLESCMKIIGEVFDKTIDVLEEQKWSDEASKDDDEVERVWPKCLDLNTPKACCKFFVPPGSR